jgi:rhodanese-related sulfurtransferase
MPMRPQSFSAIIQGNMGKVPVIPICEDLTGYAITADETDKLRKTGITLLDLRDDLSFGAAHIPGSIHVDASSSSMLNWIGVAISPGTPLLLILPSDKTFEEMRLELQRIGYDTVKGWLEGGFDAWLESGRETQSLPHISAQALRMRLAAANPPALVDVRTQKEFEQMKIEGAVNLQFDRILERDVCPDILNKETVIVCQSGFRASIAASLLQAKGCADISILSGGMGAWEKNSQ